MKFAALLLGLLTSNVFAFNLILPPTMDAGSVQAKLKNLLYEKLEKEGPQTAPYAARLTGSYGEVILEDRSAKLVCREFSAGQLAVQQFSCELTTPSKQPQEVYQIELPATMDAASVQAVVKTVLFEKLKASGPQFGHYEASLYGDYSEVFLEDEAFRIACREFSAGQLQVQQFSCNFRRN